LTLPDIVDHPVTPCQDKSRKQPSSCSAPRKKWFVPNYAHIRVRFDRSTSGVAGV